MRAEDAHGRHISGAEGIHDASIPALKSAIKAYVKRALHHPRGSASKIVITVERITGKPLMIDALPVLTIGTRSVSKSESAIESILASLGISRRAIAAAMRVVRSGRVMRGAAIVDAASGHRLDPDRRRGVRASRMGITPDAARALSRKLSRAGINSHTVREAIVLASKVAHAKGLIAELCVSDDPDYTTGYVASRRYGYVRIPNIKVPGSMSGGRVIFVDGAVDVETLIKYLEERPVLVGGVSAVKGEAALEGLLSK